MLGFEDVPIDWAPAARWFAEDSQQWHTMLQFIVPGQPIQQGNMIKNRYGAIYDKTVGLRPWRALVSRQARAAMVGRYRLSLPTNLVAPGTLEIFSSAMLLDVTFVRRRPKAMSPKKETPQHITFPDLSKLVRAIEDSLTGIVWDDDKQVVETNSRKRYAEHGETEGCCITVTSNVVVK